MVRKFSIDNSNVILGVLAQRGGVNEQFKDGSGTMLLSIDLFIIG